MSQRTGRFNVPELNYYRDDGSAWKPWPQGQAALGDETGVDLGSLEG